MFIYQSILNLKAKFAKTTLKKAHRFKIKIQFKSACLKSSGLMNKISLCGKGNFFSKRTRKEHFQVHPSVRNI